MIGSGKRYNEGKLRYDLLHPDAQKGIVEVLTSGAEKYSERNWEEGMPWSKCIASLKRHLAAIEAGEDYDKESGLLHIDHLQCNAHFLSAYYRIYPQGDDRPHKYLRDIRIGLDIDEVLCDWVGAWVQHFKMDVPDNWYFDRNILEKFEEMRKSGELDEFYLHLCPKVSPKDMPFEPYCYITSRPVDKHITERWLDHYGFPARPVYAVGVRESKVDAAINAGLRPGIDIFVDDRYENFVELNRAGICTYLFDAPHNQRYNVGHKRIKSLNELV